MAMYVSLTNLPCYLGSTILLSFAFLLNCPISAHQNWYFFVLGLPSNQDICHNIYATRVLNIFRRMQLMIHLFKVRGISKNRRHSPRHPYSTFQSAFSNSTFNFFSWQVWTLGDPIAFIIDHKSPPR